MQKVFILSIMFLANITYGQEAKKDTTLKVVYANETNDKEKPAFFIDGRFATCLFLAPEFIDNINVVKGEIKIDGIKYNGQIYIKTKSGYKPKLISLDALKDKYTNFKNKPVIFMIDGNILNADYAKYIIDENCVLEMVVDNIKNTKENIDLGLIKLLTKSEENIKRLKEIRIRGEGPPINQ